MSHRRSWLAVCVAFLATLGLGSHAAGSPQTDTLYPAASLKAGTQTVSYQSATSKYILRYDGTAGGDEAVQYEVSVSAADSAVQKGALRIYESTRNVYPVYFGGLLLSDSAGNAVQPDNAGIASALTGHSVSANTVTLDYRDTYQTVQRTKRYEITLVGKALKIRGYSTTATSPFTNNYMGFTFGYSGNASNAQRTIIPYMETMGTTMVSGTYFYQTFMDYTQSHGSVMVKPTDFGVYKSGSTTQFVNSIYISYSRLSDNTVNAVDETGWVVATSKAADMFVLGDAANSPYRREFDGAPIYLFSNLDSPDDYINCKSHVQNMHRYGVRNQKVYLWAQWNNYIWVGTPRPDSWTHPYPTVLPPSTLGGTVAELLDLVSATKSLGGRIAGYEYYYTQDNRGPDYSASGANHYADGSVKIHTPFGSTAVTVSSDTALASALYWQTRVRDEVGFNWSYVDSLGAVNPDTLCLSEYKPDGHPSQIRQCVVNRKTLFLQDKAVYNGPYLSEGDLAPAYFNHAFNTMYKGYLDVYERHLGGWPGDGANPTDNMNYFVIPDYELTSFKPYSVGAGFGLLQRFIDATWPLNDAAHDEYNATVISYGHNWYTSTTGLEAHDGLGDSMTIQDKLKAYYLICIDLQEQYSQANIQSVNYWNGAAYVDLSAALKAAMDLTIPRLRLIYDNGLTIWVNHAPTDWSVTAGGVNYTLPKNGWVAYNATDGLIDFSAIPAGQPQRFDYVYSPRYGFRMIDGRGVSTTYGGITGTDFKVVWTNGFSVTEENGDFTVVGQRPGAKTEAGAAWMLY